jgi:DNA-binding CsgD family transcriptional regulator
MLGSTNNKRIDSSSLWNELIYAAMEDPSRWTDFLNAFMSRMKASQALLSVRYDDQPAVSLAAYVGGTAEDVREYMEKWAAEDPWVKDLRMQDYGPGTIRLSHQICPDEVLERTEFYRQYLAPRQWHYGAGLVLYSRDIQAGLLSFNRPKATGPVQEEECEFLRSITPALERAVRMHGEVRRLQTELELHRAHAASVGVAFLLANERGKVLMANGGAEEILAKGDALALRDGRLQAQDETDHAILMHAVAAAGAASGNAGRDAKKLKCARGAGLPPLVVIVSPSSLGTHPRIGAEEATVCLHLVEPGLEKEINTAVLASMFDLTQAEARVAGLLAAGLTIEAAAEKLFVSRSTVRTHLKRVMEKTGCNRQAQLAVIVLNVSRRAHAAEPATA